VAGAKVLRKLLQGEKLVVVPGVYDCLTARVAKYCGFSVIYMTGYGTSAAYGYPDFGLLTMSEMVENVRRISDTAEIPLIADADTGYGNPTNVFRTVKEYERAGAAGIQLEDQTWPKRCGHMAGKTVIETAEMVSKIKAAAEARNDSDTVLVIRTDAIATQGFEEAILRAQLYADAGGDVIFIEAPSRKQMEKIPHEISKPCLLNIAFPDQDLGVKTIEDMGYKIALYPLITLVGTIGGCLRTCKSLFYDGRHENAGMPFNFEELHQFLGVEKFRELEKKFSLR
jgi:2-methylisocitrate lyase-like PEP mutase family enzyme